jgi:hypothetical protein
MHDHDLSEDNDGIVPINQLWYQWKSENSVVVLQFIASNCGLKCVVAHHINPDFTVWLLWLMLTYHPVQKVSNLRPG